MTEDEVLDLLAPLIGRKFGWYLMAGAETAFERRVRYEHVLMTRKIITVRDSDDTWRAWLYGTMDGIVGNGSPLTAIRDGRIPEVLASARRFATDPMAP